MGHPRGLQPRAAAVPRPDGEPLGAMDRWVGRNYGCVCTYMYTYIYTHI